MANQAHLDILKQGVDVWNGWRSEHPDEVPNLSGAKLRGCYLSEIDLSEADLSEADLSESFFIEANLRCVNLRGAKLIEADLSDSELRSADLSYTNLKDANLLRTNLYDANLEFTNFENCSFGKTIFGYNDLRTCIGLDTIMVLGPCTFDFPTLQSTAGLPNSFLRKMGFPELFADHLPYFCTPSLRLFPVFLSHSWRNKNFTRNLYDALIQRGVRVFFDEKKMKPGDEILESLSRGIAHYDKMILVCSKESLSESWWVDREIDRVLKKERDLFKERKEKIPLLIPITIDDYVFDWPGAKGEEVRRYMIGDFRDWQNEAHFEKALNELIQALHVDRPDVKPPSYL